MTRYDIVRESKNLYYHRQRIEPYALKWPDDKIPVTIGLSDNKLLGYASKLKRMSDGQITAEIEFFREYFNDEQPFDERLYDFFVFLNPFKSQKDENDVFNLVTVTEGFIREINIIPIPGWPRKIAKHDEKTP